MEALVDGDMNALFENQNLCYIVDNMAYGSRKYEDNLIECVPKDSAITTRSWISFRGPIKIDFNGIWKR